MSALGEPVKLGVRSNDDGSDGPWSCDGQRLTMLCPLGCGAPLTAGDLWECHKGEDIETTIYCETHDVSFDVVIDGSTSWTALGLTATRVGK